jgi:PST family polysaccharide transporter
MNGGASPADASPLTASRISGGAGWAALGAALRYVIAGITTLILAHLLTPREVGLVAITLVAGELVSYIAITGFHDAIIQRDRRLDDAYLNAAFWSATLTAGLLALIVLALAGPVAALFAQPALGPLLGVMALAGLLRAVGTVPRALLAQRLDFRTLALARAAGMVLGGCAAVLAALLGAGAWSWIVHAGVVNGAGTLIAWRAAGWRPAPQIARAHLPGLWSFAASVSSFAVLAWIISHADDQLIGYRLGPRALGFYAMAYSIMAWPVRDVLGGIAVVLYPVLARCQADRPRLQRAYLESARLMALFAFPVLTQIIVSGPTMIPWLLGDRWAPIALTMQILAFNGLRESLLMLNGPLFRAVGAPQLHTLFGACSAACYVTAFVVGLEFGIAGVAFFFTLTGIVLRPLSLWLVVRILRISVRRWLAALLPAPLAACVMAGATIALRHVAQSVVGDRAAVLLSLACGLGAYIVAIRLLAPGTVRVVVREAGRLALRWRRRD